MTKKLYSEKLSPQQNAACERLETVSGLPPVGLEQLNAGLLSAKEFWRLNLMKAHEVNSAIQNIAFPMGD